MPDTLGSGDSMSPESPDCVRHEEEINRLRERSHQHANDLTSLKENQRAIAERIPANLREWMGGVNVQLANVEANLTNIHAALQRGYVTVTEFEAIQKECATFVTHAELEPIKMAVYRGIGIILATVIVGLVSIILRTGH